MKKNCAIIILVAMGFVINPLILPRDNYALDTADEELAIYMGEIKTIPVNQPYRVAIGNPSIADVTEVSKTHITLSPKGAGTTSLIFWDLFGEHSFRVKVFTEDMQAIKARVDALLADLNYPAVKAKASDVEGKVILLGSVKTAPDRERLNTALGTLKDKIVDLVEIKEEQSVVDIDVQVLELSKDATKTLGITWPGSLGLTERSSVGIANAGTQWGTLFKVLNLQRTTGTTALTDNANPFTFKLDMLIQQGKARILSRPRLACQSGKEAQLLVGGEKPTFTTSTTEGGSTSSTVEYKEFGIKLKIRPAVADENRIKVGVDVEVSEVGTAETIGAVAAPTAKAYPLSKRTASTELYINDGETIAIGGLIKQKTEEDLRKFPWLADVPVLGLFFRQKTYREGSGTGERGNTELFITLTPKIVASKKDTKEEALAPTPEIVSPAIVEDISTPSMEYARIVQKRILEKLRYPDTAKEAGFQGRITLSLRLSYKGELLDIAVKDSSGYQILDDEAVSAAKSISAYPPFPTSIEEQELWIEVPVIYRLD